MYSKNDCLGGNLFIYSSVNGGFRLVKGGRFKHGMMSGFFSSIANSGLKSMGNVSSGLYGLVGAVTGGTAEALGGGKFANGAVTGAFVGMFNHGFHRSPVLTKERKERIAKQFSSKISSAAKDANEYNSGNARDYLGFETRQTECITNFNLDGIESDTRFLKDFNVSISIVDDSGETIYLNAVARISNSKGDITANIGYEFRSSGNWNSEGNINSGWTVEILNKHNISFIQISFSDRNSFKSFNSYIDGN